MARGFPAIGIALATLRIDRQAVIYAAMNKG
jgi:hypothetical protein